MKQPSKQPNQQGSFMESYGMAKWLMQLSALTALTLLRWDLGYRLLNPLKLIAVNGALAVFAILEQPGNESSRPIDLCFFAMLSFGAGILQKIQRWREIAQPRQHSEYIGSSFLEFRWLPAFMLRNRRMARFIEPVMVALIGVALLSLSPVLAAYLIFAGLSLRCYEYDVFERERHRELDVSDGLIMAQYQGEVVEQYEGASGLQPSQARPGLPTGVSADLQANIKRRQANRS